MTDEFFLNVYFNSSKPKSCKIEKVAEDEYWFDVDGDIYTSIVQLLAVYQSSKGSILLQECLPPSEYGTVHCVCTLGTLYLYT